MSYRALYREWRPQNFRSLVGQDHISKTLQNAVIKGRIAHAYLFAGPRGTGKTSTAKIMAKAVNCLAPQEGEPCNLCSNCENINSGRSLDVVEIDAASNRGIDEIRELRERVGFVPSQGKYRVYIIDEVHMLTAEAFNALLKTLEEPPGHIIFILATTEPQRIPSTIHSRCQRFDFRKISPADIEERLKKILAASGMTVEEGVLSLMAKKAEGGLRDAISILDQCISFSHEHITLQTAYEVLGMVKSEALIALTEALTQKDAAGLFVQINSMLKEGLEPGQILQDLLEHLRNMILLLVCGPGSPLVLAGDEEKEIMLRQARKLGLSWLSKTVSLLAKISSESRWRQNMRAVLETTLVGLLVADEDDTAAAGLYEREKLAPAKAGKEAVHPVPEKNMKQEGVSIENRPPVITLETVKEKWPQVMELVRNRKKTVYAFLAASEPNEIKDGELVIAFKSGYTFHKEKVEETENKKIIEEALEKILGIKLRLACSMEEEKQDPPGDPVRKALDLFGSGIVIIKD
ncbi:MAG: DNA polymerase III subunit gamma/tau [Peptococcaceae bacterium]|nr:DNA polymerase III subunit gamma/tau [Peptococcaceae bacterium]MDH7523855.1 DNA polymerase III subunit gamma/tau [Peptococcaceae bacterium]